MSHGAAIPLGLVLLYVVYRLLVGFVFDELGMSLPILPESLTGLLVVVGAGGTFIAVFGGFVAPVLFQRHLDRMDVSKANGASASTPRGLRWASVALSTVAIAVGSCAWLATTQLVDWPFVAHGSVAGTMLYFGGLGCIGVGVAALLTIWTFRYPEFESVTPRFLPYNGGMTEAEAQGLVGMEGRVQAALRPQGNLKLDGVTYVVRSEGHFVEEGTLVRVDRVDGLNIVVCPVTEKT